MQDTWDLGSIPGLGRSPREGSGNPCQCSCLGNSMDRGSWQATVQGSQKSQTQLKWLSTQGQFDSFIKPNHRLPGSSDGKESACNAGDPGSDPGSERSPGEGSCNHSSILAWRIPWTEEPGELQYMGSKRVRHDCVTNTSFHHRLNHVL